ncbi:response regulator [Phaeocystidibacter luteus]|uniref:Response regulator n=1 Tax=Phaeocystidibacter luteus TaxID=911197 RepID=A0A6N6RKV3_9FLAO|nr:response regulator [Phaeocystidibacter luteus]KAB2813939.1 response regulator [Phaeocystidibacter luteus]
MKQASTKVLIVEANDLYRFIIEKMMNKRGLTPISVSSFDAGVYELQRHDFALVLFDMRLAELSDQTFATDFLKTLKDRGISNVALSDSAYNPNQLAWQDLGFVDCLVKPFRFECLDRVLNAHLFNKVNSVFIPAR